jgi:hypothetical protein
MVTAKLPILAPAGASLCETCMHARLVKGHAERQQIVVCTRYFDPVIVPFPVRECSDYAQNPALNLARVKELTWEIQISYDGASENYALASGKIDLNKRNDDA